MPNNNNNNNNDNHGEIMMMMMMIIIIPRDNGRNISRGRIMLIIIRSRAMIIPIVSLASDYAISIIREPISNHRIIMGG